MFAAIRRALSASGNSLLLSPGKFNLSFRALPEHSVLRVQAFPRPVFVPALAFVSFARRRTVSLQDVSSCHFGRCTNPRITVQRGRSVSALPQDRISQDLATANHQTLTMGAADCGEYRQAAQVNPMVRHGSNGGVAYETSARGRHIRHQSRAQKQRPKHAPEPPAVSPYFF
jgi:hypothetical protein